MQISRFLMSPVLHRRAAGCMTAAAMQNKTENLVQSSNGAPTANPAGSKKANPLEENISRLQAQLAEAASPDEKAAIQQQLRQLGAQIKSKDSAAYRQSHAHYWQA